MGKVNKQTTGANGNVNQPLAPVDLISQYGGTQKPFSNVEVQEATTSVKFNPLDYEYLDNPSSQEIGTADVNAAKQPLSDQVGRSLKQFGANVLGSIVTSAAHSADIGSTFDILANKQSDFNSTLFGVSTKDIMDWTEGVTENNKIYENSAGNFDPSDPAWWANQFATSGTGVGMALYALGETAAVTAATEGTGAVPEIFNQVRKLPQLMRMMKAAKTAEQALEVANLAKNLRRTATTYAILNRLNESKMEAQQTYQESYNELKLMKNSDGTPKYTEEEAKTAAASGARRDFLWNMPLMALDILTYRTMVFNPLSGAGEGVVEKGLANVAGRLAKKGAIGKAAGWLLPHAVGSVSEGLEEGLQYVGSNEGKHYARVLSGLDDKSTFLGRLGQDVTSDEFWNNFSGGVIGSPIIGGTMRLFNKAMNGRSQQRLANLHNDFVNNVGQMDAAIGQLIRDHESDGNTELAKILRRNFGANKALSALYLDSLKGSGAALDSYRNFLQETLDEVKQGKLDSLKDLGFNNPTGTQVEQITQEFQTYLNDTNRMERIFNQVSNQHERQFVAPIAQQMFSLETRREKQAELNTQIESLKNDVFGYNSLSQHGKEIHDINYELLALNNELKRLEKEKASTANPLEKDNYNAVIKSVEDQIDQKRGRITEINNTIGYTAEMKDADASIISTPVKDERYYSAIRQSVANTSQINLEGRDLALWNNKAYRDEQSVLSIINSRTLEQLQDMEQDLINRGRMTDKISEAIKDKKAKLATEQAIAEERGRQEDTQAPVVTSPEVEQAQEVAPERAAPVETPSVSQDIQNQLDGEGALIFDEEGNHEWVPSNDPTQAVAVNPTEPQNPQGSVKEETGNSDLFSEAMQDIVSVSTEQLTNTQTQNDFEYKDVHQSKLEIPNFDELVEDASGRVQVRYDGEDVKFKTFDINIVSDQAIVDSITTKPGQEKYAIVTLAKLGNELAKKGILLVGNTKKAKEIWEALREEGFAVLNDTTYRYTDKINNIPDAEIYNGGVEVSLAPVEVNNNLTPDQKSRLVNAVNILMTDKLLGTFEDLVRASIKQSNLDTADKTFNLLSLGWEASGRQPADYKSVYTKVFQDPMGEIASLLGELGIPNNVSEPQNPSTTEIATEVAVEDAIDQDNKPTDFTPDGIPIFDYTGIVTEEVQKKFAFLTVPYVETRTPGEDGSITIDRESILGELNQGDHVDSLKLLDPNKYIEGTEMEVRIPSNYLDIKVSVTNEDGTPGTAIPFGQYVAERNLKDTDQEYKDKIPMIIYDKGQTNQRGVAFIHDVQWYNPANFLQTKPGEMEQAIKTTREFRDEVLEAKGKAVGITITAKRETTFDGLKLPSGQHITLREANPQSTITVAMSTDANDITSDGKNRPFEGQLMNFKPLVKGFAYDVRQTGRKDGKPVYTAFPLTQPQLSDLSKSSINWALKVFVNTKNPNLTAGDKQVFDRIHAQILATSAIDIRSIVGIQQYLQQFMHVQVLNNVNSVNDAENQLKAIGKPEGFRYLTINSAGGITFGTLGVPMSPKNNGYFINPNGKTEDSFKYANNFLSQIVKSNFLLNYQQHVHFGSLNKNKPVVQFDGQGKPVSTNTYKEYLQNTLLTNVRSLNLGTETKPNYVTNVQPVITYESNSKLSKASRPQTLAEVREEVVPENTVVDERVAEDIGVSIGNPEEAEANLETLRKDQEQLIEQARQELGLDFLREDDVDLDDLSLAPVELTEAQREAIAESIDRIAGLNPQQQYQLIDFMYNQVASMLEVGNKEAVSKDQVYKRVKESFESVVKPLRKTYIDKVKQLKQMIELDPNSPHIKELKLAAVSYNRSIERINDIQANYKLMEQETAKWVEKYTNIEQGKLVDNMEEDEDSAENETSDGYSEVADGSRDRDKEFGTDSLTENPDYKMTYAMRRFLGSIRSVDNEGNPATGFLRLPLYVGSDVVTKTVRAILADVPSNFDTMIAKLESAIPAHPWLKELVDRLQASNMERKNQFVTVMSNHRLTMKFSMISYNRKNNTWSAKVYNTFQTGLAAQLLENWYNNFIDGDLVTTINEVYALDETTAQELVKEYDSWIGGNVKSIKAPINSIVPQLTTISKKHPYVYVTPTGELAEELKVLKEGDRIKFANKGIQYQLMKDQQGYRVSFFNATQAVNPTNSRQWLERMGIVMSDKGWNELITNGLYHNYQRVKGDALYTGNNGLFKILSDSLKRGLASDNKDLVTGDNPFNESVLKSLANLESNYNTTVISPNGRDGGKSIFGFTAPKFITDRTRDLKTPNSDVVNALSSTSFSKTSLWLRLLTQSSSFRDQFEVSHMGLTAIKELGKKVYKDNGITKLSDTDHELTKLIMFWDTKQGNVSFDNNTRVYGDTSIEMRMATMFVPTMSDKSNMMLLKTAVLNLEDKHFATRSSGLPKVGSEVTKAIYEQAVRPEILRMIEHARLGGKTNISAYDKGARMFLLMPSMNYIKWNDELSLVDAIAYGVREFDLAKIESRPDLMDKIYHEIEETLEALADQKIGSWDKAGFFVKKEQPVLTSTALLQGDASATSSQITQFKYVDKDYLNKFSGTLEEKVYKAAIDFEVNSMISNANSFMLYAGDPAIYYKSKSEDYIKRAEDTFVNVGKRLANQIAPGQTIANSENEQYIQIFLDDRKSLPEIPFLKFSTRVNDGKAITDEEIEILRGNDKDEKKKVAKRYPKSAGYFEIEGSDAQEYTTWREHLSLLERMGKTPDSIFEITPEEIREARELFSSFEKGKRAKLTDRQQKLIGKVLQPMKPVYTGQIYDAAQDVMRTMYIKSSSFPLIPQLTAGLEIDHLRQVMEEVEKKSGKNVRASYQTANKVGSVNNAVKIWNPDGTINKENVSVDRLMPVTLADDKSNMEEFLNTQSLVLSRKNFRIQMDVPFKSGKKKEDKITLGTQLMKILFGNGVIDADNFSFEGQQINGKELHRIYNESFDSLIKLRQQQLYHELGLDEEGNPIDEKKSIEKLQKILKAEAEGRGYPIQDIEGLNLDSEGNFITPLWSSANSNRYEAMLNAIVTNRMVKIKFPGNSYVVGSEEGFKFQENLEEVDKSKVIWTSKWNGKGLQGSFKKDGNIEKAQVLVASKFRDNEGNLIDLFTKEDGKYVYVIETPNGFGLKEDMFDTDLLSLTSFRIPTSGHVSAAQIEIVGFLPAESADLMIVPRNFTKQMGLDFDIDKQNTYQLWHYQNPDTKKFEVLREDMSTGILDKVLGDKSSAFKFLQSIADQYDLQYNEEDINENDTLRLAKSKFDEKILQNKIINVHKSVLTNPNDEVQAKINGILSTDYAEEQADIISALINTSEKPKVFTPLSSEYQKMKMGLGAAGKIGTGAYSLDVTMHSLMQQAKSLGKELSISRPVISEDGEVTIQPMKFRFGNQVSDGVLGNEMTIDGSRSIAEVLAELQNIALDNEKLQVMGRVGLNDLTIDVSKVFALLGFDKGTDEGKSSVQFLFLSQPIIRDYVEMIKNLSSNMAEFTADKEQSVISKLVAKYMPDDVTGEKFAQLFDEDFAEEMAKRMGTKEMIANLETDKPDGQLQVAILNRFLEMKKYGETIRGVQVGINTDAKGLGKSFFDVIAKRDALNKVGKASQYIQGVTALIGDYISVDEINEMPAGYVDIGEYYVKPNTLTGSFNIYAITTAYEMWSKHLPYDTGLTNRMYDEILEVISQDGESTGLINSKAISLKQDIFKAFKKYFSANPMNGIINTGDDPNTVRAQLYIDTDENTSLAKYLKDLTELTDNKTVKNYIKTNPLISRFQFTINKNGEPSLIKFNNAVGEDFDEQYLYNSLSNLLAADEPLPSYNGRDYNTSKLAQDLIAYAYLGNATQEAIQFTKYVPVTYNNITGYSAYMRDVSQRLVGDVTLFGVKMQNPDTFSFDSDFTVQFVQHNPERVKFKLNAGELKNRIINVKGTIGKINTIESFSLKLETEQKPPKYISVYDSSIEKGEKKFRLFMHEGNNVYKKIPVLGTFGMDEYNPTVSVNQSLVNGRVKVTAKPTNIGHENTQDATNDLFAMNSGNGKTVVDNIVSANLEGYSALAAALSPFLSSVEIGYGDIAANGMYDSKSGKVTISSRLASDRVLLAKTVLHELVHALTVNQINQYVSKVGDTYQVKPNAPAYVSRLLRLFNEAQKVIGKDKIDSIRSKIDAQKAISLGIQTAPKEDVGLTSQEMLSYGAFNIMEFMAYSLTEPEFQREMSKHQYRETGQTLWVKFKELLNSILQAIGVNYDENSITAQAINSTFDLISGENKRTSTPIEGKFNEMAEVAFGDFGDMLTEEEKDMLMWNDLEQRMDFEGDTEISFSPQELPVVPNLNENNCY